MGAGKKCGIIGGTISGPAPIFHMDQAANAMTQGVVGRQGKAFGQTIKTTVATGVHYQ